MYAINNNEGIAHKFNRYLVMANTLEAFLITKKKQSSNSQPNNCNYTQ